MILLSIPFHDPFQVFFSFMLWTAILTIFGAGSVSGIGKRSVEDWDSSSSYLYNEEERYEEDLKTWKDDMRRWEQDERKRKDEVVNNWFSNLFSSFTSTSSSNGEARLGVSFTDASFLAVLDDTFTFASTTKQFVLNSMGVGSDNDLRIAFNLMISKLRLLAVSPSSHLCLTYPRT